MKNDKTQNQILGGDTYQAGATDCLEYSADYDRDWHEAYLSVGSNMGDREAYIRQALESLQSRPHIKVCKVSALIETEAYGGVEQGDFLNGAILVKTLLSPKGLLEALHEIEQAAGRERTIRWGPRTLDLDILFYDKLVYEDDGLVIPHIDLQNRYFVLKPLGEIAPDYRHPLTGQTVRQMLDALPGFGIPMNDRSQDTV